MERLGLGPDVVAGAQSAALSYGRMTGWGQQGPLAQAAGHDINYISVTGALGRDRHQRQTGAAAQSGRRFRRRSALSGGRRASRRYWKRQSLARDRAVDAAMCDGAASADVDVLRQLAAAGPVDRRAREQFPRRVARISTAFMNADVAGSFRSARSSRNSTRCCAGTRVFPTPTFDAQMDRKAWPALQAKTGGCIQDQDPRRVVRAIMEGHRRLLRADPDHGRGPRSSAQMRPRRDFRQPATGVIQAPRRRRGFSRHAPQPSANAENGRYRLS